MKAIDKEIREAFKARYPGFKFQGMTWKGFESGFKDAETMNTVTTTKAELARVTEALRKMKSSRNWNRVANKANRRGREQAEAKIKELTTTLEDRDATIEALTDWMHEIEKACGFEEDTADALQMVDRVRQLTTKEG